MTVSFSSQASFEIDADVRAPSVARRQITGVAPMHGIDGDLRAEVQLLLSELVTNVVAHEQAERITVEVELTVRGQITVTVTGRPDSPLAPLAPPRLPAATDEHGRGLFLVDAIATDWGTRRREGRTSVWFSLAGEPHADTAEA